MLEDPSKDSTGMMFRFAGNEDLFVLKDNSTGYNIRTGNKLEENFWQHKKLKYLFPFEYHKEAYKAVLTRSFQKYK